MASTMRLLSSRARNMFSNRGMSKISPEIFAPQKNHWSGILSTTANRFFSADTKHRNIGISAHIDR